MFQVLRKLAQGSLFVMSAILVSGVFLAHTAHADRDPWLHPFSQDSIWNTPIGSNADYQAFGHFPGTGYIHSDDEYHYKTYDTDPVRPIYSPNSWTNRCEGTIPGQVELSMHIADDIMLPDAITTGGVYETPNNVATFLKPDGRTLLQLEPLCRDQYGGPVYGYQYPVNEDIYGTGIHGTHWGSGLSGFGGSIRHGELTGTDPLKHVLKLNVWGKYLYYDSADSTPGYRWPADRADAKAAENYQGTNPVVQMGALVAIHPDATAQSLGLTSEPAIKMFNALKDYGAYIVDDTGWDAYGFSLTIEARKEFNEHYGFSFNQSSGASGDAGEWYDDMTTLIENLYVVDNNGPQQIGGGGTPRAPLADPDFTAMDSTAPSTPSSLTIADRTTSSVSLSWTGSTDNVRVMEYEIYSNGRKIGSTYGNTTYTVKGLEPNGSYNYQVRAKDTNTNVSDFSNQVIAFTHDGYLEGFDSGTAADWTLTHTIVEFNKLKATQWGGLASAVYDGRSFSAPGSGDQYVYTSTIHTDSDSDSGKTRIYFNYADGSNAYFVEFGGGSSNTVKLKKIAGGSTTTLSTYNGSYPVTEPTKIEIIYENGGLITVKGHANQTETTLFDQVQDTDLTSGKIGFGVQYSQSFQDNIEVIVNPDATMPTDSQAPTAPANVTEDGLTDRTATLSWTAASDNYGGWIYEIYDGSAKMGQTYETSHTVIDLAPNTAYSFTVVAKDASGNTSAASSPLNVTTPETRDKWLKPFSSDSIWNMPIGSDAAFEPIQLPVSEYVHSDDEYHWKVRNYDPEVTIYEPGSWTNRCDGTANPQGTLKLPDDYIVPDAIVENGVYETPNNVAAFLQTDGNTLLQLEPLCRDTAGGPVYGFRNFNDQTLTGTGYYGTHWGSGLSGFGGSIRHGELTGSEPIEHALKINIWGQHLYYDANDATPGYRWPADRADANAPNSYQGTNPKLEMGALLAIPDSVTAESLGLTTAPAIKLFNTLKNYGAYIVDDTGWNAYAFSLSREARFEFKEEYGYSFNQPDTATGEAKDWFDDFNALVGALQIVDNNDSANIGGGGTPLAPLAPPLSDYTDITPPTEPTNLSVVDTAPTSVSLSWTASTDNVRVMQYVIYDGETKIGETYGQTSATVHGLTKGTTYNLSVKAIDTGLNESESSQAIQVTTDASYNYNEDFNDDLAQDWVLNQAVAENQRLKITNWSGTDYATYDGEIFYDDYVYSVGLQTDGQSDNAKTRVVFNCQDDQNMYYVELGGGDTNTVTLNKVVDGTATTLSTYSGSYPIRDWSFPLIEVTFDYGTITVKGIDSGTETVLFDQIQDTSFSSGHIGVGVVDNQSFADTVSVQ